MKVVICGAGIAGLANAVELGRRGWDVLMVERAPQRRAGGYMIDFFGPGYDAAEEMGMLEALNARAYDVSGLEMVNADGSRQAWTSYDLLRKSVGGRVFSLLRGDIEDVLFEALPNNVNLRFNTTVTAIENRPDGVSVDLSDGSQVDADLLLGADGIHSHSRSLAFGPKEWRINDLGFRVAAYVFDAPRMLEVIGDRFIMISVPMRQVGIYALREGKLTAFFIWRGDDDLVDPQAVLRRHFGDMGWVVPQMLDAMPETDEIYADLTGQVEMESWRKRRVMVTGDAAFAVSLLAGQGASLAIGAAHALGSAIDAHDRLDAALDAYEATVRPTILEKQAAGRRTAKWFVPATKFQLWIRATVMGLTAVPILSRVVESFVATSPKGVFSAGK